MTTTFAPTARLQGTLLVQADEVWGQDILHTSDGAVQVESVEVDRTLALVVITALVIGEARFVEYVAWQHETFLTWQGWGVVV